jgi:hypothetical protein
VHLADAGLGDAQDLPDLGQGALHLLGLEHGHRVLGALVLRGVDQAEPVAALGAGREQLVEGDHRHERDLVEDLVPLVGGLRCRRFSRAT